MVTDLREMDPQLPVKEALIEMGQDTQAIFREAGDIFVVHRSDLQKLIAMGLADLPIESIAVAQSSPILHLKDPELRHTLNIANQLTGFFPGHMVAALYELQSLMKKGELRAYVIGGNVRDLLLYRERRLEIEDVDITIEGDAISSSQYIVANSRNFVVEEIFPEFGTVKISYKGSIQFDIASTRKEVYRCCSALPEVIERGVPLAEDITRRDFSVNALAMSIHELGLILDHANGIEDVENRLIRVLHPLSFFEDPSRILRAFKFLARLDFNLTSGTDRLLRQFLKHGHQVYNGGGDRIKYELRKFLGAAESDAKQRWLAYFLETGSIRLANMAIPARPASPELKRRIELLYQTLPITQEILGEPAQTEEFLWMLYLCPLLGELDDGLLTETCHRLGLTRIEREALQEYVRLRSSFEETLGGIHEFSAATEIYEVYKALSPVAVVAAATEKFGEDPARFQTVLQALKAYRDKFSKIKPELNGKDLMELGVPEGEAIGQLLRELLHLKLSGRLPDRMDEIRYVQQKLEAADAPKTAFETEEVINDTSE